MVRQLTGHPASLSETRHGFETDCCPRADARRRAASKTDGMNTDSATMCCSTVSAPALTPVSRAGGRRCGLAPRAKETRQFRWVRSGTLGRATITRMSIRSAKRSDPFARLHRRHASTSSRVASPKNNRAGRDNYVDPASWATSTLAGAVGVRITGACHLRQRSRRAPPNHHRTPIPV